MHFSIKLFLKYIKDSGLTEKILLFIKKITL